jgi:hypothetical protein
MKMRKRKVVEISNCFPFLFLTEKEMLSRRPSTPGKMSNPKGVPVLLNWSWRLVF